MCKIKSTLIAALLLSSVVNAQRLIPSVISTGDSYTLELGNLSMRFYRDGGIILDTSGGKYTILTVFATDELDNIQFAQTDDEMYLVDGTDIPQILTRTDHADWSITDIDFETGPFLLENETTTTITPTGYSFTDDTSAETFTITGSGDLSDLFPDGGTFIVGGSTDNDDTWTVDSTNSTDPFVITVTEDITGDDDDGSIIVQGGVVTLTASADLFESTTGASHVGSLWAIDQERGNSTIRGDFKGSTNGTSISSPFFRGTYGFVTKGDWVGTVTLQRSTNNGISWRSALEPFVDTNFDNPAEVEDDGAIYRVVMSNHVSGKMKYTFTITEATNKGIVKITAVASATSATATVITSLTTADATTTWREGYWSDFRGWPKTVVFHQQRLIFGGSTAYPQVLWFGKQDPDDYTNFLEGTLDTSAFTAALEGQNPIRWLLSQDYLIIGSSGTCGIWGERGKSATPTSPRYQDQTRHGAAAIPAVLGGDSVLYVERGARNVREFSFNFQFDKYLSPDLTVLSPEITESGIVDMAFQLRPEPILWCVLGNGNIATLTYQRDQSVVAWSLQLTDGDFESVAVIPSPSGTEDQVWVVVARVIDSSTVRYVEQFQPRDFGSDPNDAWFVDAGITYTGSATDTFTGAEHLEGETVSIYADLLIESPEVVVSGGFTIDNDASRVLVGMPYTSKLETMPLVIDPQDKAVNKKIRRVWFDLLESGTLSYGNGPDSTLTSAAKFFENSLIADPSATAQDFHTSRIKPLDMRWVYGSTKKQTVYIEVSDPMPLIIRSITPAYTMYGN